MNQDLADVIDYLRSKVIAVLSTISEGNLPQSATVFYWIGAVTEQDFDLFFVTRRHTRKSMNILRNPAVSMVVGTDLAPVTVQIEGTAELVEESSSPAHLEHLAKLVETQPQVAKLYTGAFFPRAPFSGLEGKDFAVFRVRPRWVRRMSYDEEKKEITYRQVLP